MLASIRPAVILANSMMRNRVSKIALSTMWSQRYNHMDRFVQDVQEFRFTQVELNSIITPEKLDELLKLGIEVSSIHCPCPVTTSRLGIAAASLQLSSLDEAERREALRCARATIELASQVRAKAVVVHAGKVEIDSHLEDRLHQLYDYCHCEPFASCHSEGEKRPKNLAQGKLREAISKEFGTMRQQLIQQRASHARPYFEAARRSLIDLADFAQGRDVKLGIETRFHFCEIPRPEEMDQLLQELPSDLVGYWHDVGHAEVNSRLGFAPHRVWFEKFKSRLIGVHIHDVRGIRDHCAPGTGDLDWDFIAQNLPPSIIKVCEIGEWNPPGACADAVPFLKSRGIV
jgi:sugar phosphate isomerase/epimerase